MSRFVAALPIGSLREGIIAPAMAEGVYVALYMIDGRLYCTEDVCTHEDNPLSDGGFVDGEEVECSYHGARFNVTDGRVTQSPAIYPLRTYPVEVRDEVIYVDVG